MFPHGPNGCSDRTLPAGGSGLRTLRRKSSSRRRARGAWEGGKSIPASTKRVSGGSSTANTRDRGTIPCRSFSRLVHSGRRGLPPMQLGSMLRHVTTLPAIVAGAWYGVEQGSRGAFLLAGVGALAWLVWPETSRFLAWRRRRRAEARKARIERSMSRAEREVAKAERARQRADRRPSSARRARRAARMEARAQRAVATAAQSRDRATAIGDNRSPKAARWSFRNR